MGSFVKGQNHQRVVDVEMLVVVCLWFPVFFIPFIDRFSLNHSSNYSTNIVGILIEYLL